MFNVGGGELLVIMLVALIILGPAKLPEVARQVGAMARELRRISSGFQDEMKAALDEPIEEAARERGRKIVASEETAAPETKKEPETAVEPVSEAEPSTETEPSAETEQEPEVSTAEAAGMYNIDPAPAVDDEARPETATGDPEDESTA